MCTPLSTRRARPRHARPRGGASSRPMSYPSHPPSSCDCTLRMACAPRRIHRRRHVLRRTAVHRDPDVPGALGRPCFPPPWGAASTPKRTAPTVLANPRTHFGLPTVCTHLARLGTPGGGGCRTLGVDRGQFVTERTASAAVRTPGVRN